MSRPLWLASGSPRRRQLLEWVGLSLEVHPADIDEGRDPSDDPITHARSLAERKAASGPADRVIVAADTVVHIDDALYEKPIDRTEAASHLRVLSGRWHSVTTGVCVRRGERSKVFAVTTRVRFRDLDDAEIAQYVQTGEPDDKAGAYGIQGLGGALVAELQGSWTNVMGLPLEETLAALQEISA